MASALPNIAASCNCTLLDHARVANIVCDMQIILAWLMAYAVAAIVKKDGKPYVDMAAVNEAPAGTFFWVSLTPLQMLQLITVLLCYLTSAVVGPCLWLKHLLSRVHTKNILLLFKRSKACLMT